MVAREEARSACRPSAHPHAWIFARFSRVDAERLHSVNVLVLARNAEYRMRLDLNRKRTQLRTVIGARKNNAGQRIEQRVARAVLRCTSGHDQLGGSNRGRPVAYCVWSLDMCIGGEDGPLLVSEVGHGTDMLPECLWCVESLGSVSRWRQVRCSRVGGVGRYVGSGERVRWHWQ